jgi:Epoxide hydrolase N terminus/Phage integrase family
MATSDSSIRQFQVEVSEAELTELRRRINATRWSERETVADDSQGLRLAMMQELARYWATDYDKHKCEAALNALPNFRTEIDGLDIHFIHARSQHQGALPLIVTHGWRFATRTGAALDAANVRREFRAACKAAKVGPDWTPRELRHSFVSLMSSSGVPIEEIARLAGHSSTRTTEVVYRRELRPVLTTGAEIMDTLFKTPAPQQAGPAAARQ